MIIGKTDLREFINSCDNYQNCASAAYAAYTTNDDDANIKKRILNYGIELIYNRSK